MSVEIHTPITEEAAAILQVGDTVTITGYILCGRDAVLPKVWDLHPVINWRLRVVWNH